MNIEYRTAEVESATVPANAGSRCGLPYLDVSASGGFGVLRFN